MEWIHTQQPPFQVAGLRERRMARHEGGRWAARFF